MREQLLKWEQFKRMLSGVLLDAEMGSVSLDAEAGSVLLGGSQLAFRGEVANMAFCFF